MKAAIFTLILFFGAMSGVLSQSKYSTETKELAEKTVVTLQEKGYLKVDLESEKAWIAPIFWENIEADGKQEVLARILVYTEVKKRKNKIASFDFYDKTTGKKIASYSSFSGFDLEY